MDDGLKLYEKFSTENFNFPEFPKNKLDFVSLVYSTIEDTDYTLTPYQYWIPIFRSKAKRMYLLMARQLFKTTFFALSSAFTAATKKRATTAYCAPDEDKLSTYADQKYRSELLDASLLLKSCIFGHSAGLPGRRTKVQWLNGSFNWHVTDEGSYRKIEGKSGDLAIYDEFQEHDAAALPKAKEAMSKKIGDEMFGGVGGEFGSPQEALWQETSQSEWHYDNEDDYIDSAGRIWPNQGWRKELQFGKWEDNHGDTYHGLIFGDYMKDVCKGEWIEEAPENYMFPGWHLSQAAACHVPLSMADCENLYRIPKEYSIEYKEMTYPRLMSIAHVQGWFYKAPRKPITRQDALATLNPYKYLYFMSPRDVQDLRTVFPGRIRILFGADWGSGNDGQGQTVFTIMMKWLGVNEYGKYSPEKDRYFVIYQERLPYELSETISEAYYGIELFTRYNCDFGAADLGYGVKQVKAMIEGGYDPRDGQYVDGVGYSKFVGTWTRGKITKVQEDNPGEIDDEGSEEITHLLLDKTSMIEDFINLVKWKVPHPRYMKEEKLSRRKLGIAYGDEWKTYPLVKDMTSITRVDIETDFLTTKQITTESPKTKYGHPPDSVVSMCHCVIADNHFTSSGEFAGSYRKATKSGGSSFGSKGSSGFRGTRSRT